jgi:hypothetical protein
MVFGKFLPGSIQSKVKYLCNTTVLLIQELSNFTPRTTGHSNIALHHDFSYKFVKYLYLNSRGVKRQDLSNANPQFHEVL